VFVREIRSAQHFVDVWTGLIHSDSIDTVYIIAHGHYTYVDGERIGNIWFGNTVRGNGRTHLYAQSHSAMGERDRAITDLRPRNMGYLYLSSCNTANPDFTVNILNAFFDHNPGICAASGWDGGVGFTFFSNREAVRGFVENTWVPPWFPVGGAFLARLSNAFSRGNINVDGASPRRAGDTFGRLMGITGNIREPGMVTLTRCD